MLEFSESKKSMKKIGKCRICGEEGYLTFEHIPPRSAGNKQEARVITNDSFTKLVTDKKSLLVGFIIIKMK